MGKIATGVLAILVIALLVLNIVQFWYFNYLRPGLLAEGEPMPILDLKGSNWQSYIGKRVTIEGYYFSTRRQVPMLVSSLDLLRIDSPIPKDKFLRLNGTIPDSLQEYMGDVVHVTGTAQESSDSEEKIVLLFESYKHVQFTLSHYLETAIHVVVTIQPFLRTKFAVLISGGVDPSMAYMRYWNDLKYMYSILRNRYGYAPENIYVIYKNGIGEDSEIPVNYSATIANVQATFTALTTRMTSKDTLFLFTNNHGSYTPDTNGDEPEPAPKYDEVLCLWGQDLSDDQLATMLAPLNYIYRMTIFMKQCFSGGFVWDLSGEKRVIMTACTQYQFSWSADTEGEYGEFSYHFMKAVNLEVAADSSGDGRVSMLEAFNYASTHDSRPETPNDDDNADHVGNTALLPNGGDGALGEFVYL